MTHHRMSDIDIVCDRRQGGPSSAAACRRHQCAGAWCGVTYLEVAVNKDASSLVGLHLTPAGMTMQQLYLLQQQQQSVYHMM